MNTNKLLVSINKVLKTKSLLGFYKIHKLLFVVLVLVSLLSNEVYGLSSEQQRVFDSGAGYVNVEKGNACSPSALGSSGGSSVPSNVPEPLKTIFSDAANTHSADATLLSVIYATENALYSNDRHLESDWLVDKVNSNNWATSGGGAKGPFQFLNSTWNSYKEEGPYIYESGAWTTKKGAGDGINVNHIDDAAFAAAKFLANIGGKAGVPLGSVDQDFSKNNAVGDTIASTLKNYNGGPATWKENGIWYKPSGPWPESKQREIDGYIQNGLEMYVELAGGAGATNTGCNSVAVGDIDIIDLSDQADSWPEFKDRPIMSNPSAIILHWTGGSPNTTGQDFIGAIAGRPGSCCGVQFYVNASGEIFQLTNPIHEVTSHVAKWNEYAIGIEIAAGSDRTVETAKREILSQTAQQESVAQLVLFLMNEYNIPADPYIPTDCDNVSADPPVGLMGHIDYPCSGKVDPSREYVDLIRSKVSNGS